MAKAIMFQGTSSNVGKSILCAGFCRILQQLGYSVAPFKAQNMALNSYVTTSGHEMGMAQAVQAGACGITPDVLMNPVLLKPSAGMGTQVVVLGKPAGHMNLETYSEFKARLREVIHDSYHTLAGQYDFIVIEGAGSPAEVNLKDGDLTNMHMAHLAQAPVIIVGDIDKGGVYAHFAGTFDLLDDREQKRTAGFIINKFRGHRELLEPANRFIEERTGRKIFGVVPWIENLGLPDEDSVEFKKRVDKNIEIKPQTLNIALIDLPHISNFTDFDALESEPDVNLFATSRPGDLERADMVIIPGSKNTVWDLDFIRQKGLDKAIKNCANQDIMVVGICAGFQVLGNEIKDPGMVESKTPRVPGLGLLDMTTTMGEGKHLTRVEGRCLEGDIPVSGYEIHHGESSIKGSPFIVNQDGQMLGSHRHDKPVWGTYIHGIFHGMEFRTFILNKIRKKKGLPIPGVGGNVYDPEKALSRLAAILEENTDITSLLHLLGIKS